MKSIKPRRCTDRFPRLLVWLLHHPRRRDGGPAWPPGAVWGLVRTPAHPYRRTSVAPAAPRAADDPRVRHRKFCHLQARLTRQTTLPRKPHGCRAP